MAIWEQWGVPLAVLGLIVATLFMSAVVKRYQAQQALIRARIQRISVGISTIEQSLETLRGVSLSRELRLTLRGDVLARYQQIARLYRRYPVIAQRLQAAEQAMQAEGGSVASGVGPIADSQQFTKIMRAIDALHDLVGEGQTIQPIPNDVRGIFCRELGERRAEANARYHLTRSQHYAEDGDASRARAHITTLMQVLKKRGPDTEFVRELYAEAEQALNGAGTANRKKTAEAEGSTQETPAERESA